MSRTADITRTTNETDITLRLGLDGDTTHAVANQAVANDAVANGEISTGHGFLDHMLSQVQRHGRFRLEVRAKGDLEVDVHHLAEDCGIVLGQAVREALGDRRGIERYGHAFVPMDESLAHVVVDLSGRPFLAFEPGGFEGHSGGFNAHHLRELLRGFCNHAGATVHVRVLAGQETHHVCEAVVKAFARSLSAAVRLSGDSLPSTKGVL
ncbi:MAG: imidazoleglycerol-phosphate dehydratase HisB [Trueperaceae bacterium]